jgi:hypothetical protein
MESVPSFEKELGERERGFEHRVELKNINAKSEFLSTN